MSLLKTVPLPQAVRPPDHFIDSPHTEFRHDLSKLHSHKGHKIHHVFGLSCKSPPQFLILRSYSDRTCIFRTNPHHHAAEADKRSSCKSILLRSKQGSYGNIPAGHEFAVRLDPDSGSETALDKGFVRLCNAEFPRKSGVVD